MRKSIIAFIALLCVYNIFLGCGKNSKVHTSPSPSPSVAYEGDTAIPDSRMALFEAMGVDTVTRYSDLTFDDGTNIERWGKLYDSAFHKGTASSLDFKLQQLIKRINQKAIYLNGPFPQYAGNHIAYVWGSKQYKQVSACSNPPKSHQCYCSEPLNGLDCSGFIYQLFNVELNFKLNLEPDLFGTANLLNTDLWNIALYGNLDYSGLVMVDEPDKSITSLKSGDIIISPSEHIGIIVKVGNRKKIIHCIGSYNRTCAINKNKSHGVTMYELAVPNLDDHFPNYHILRFVNPNPDPSLPVLTTNGITSITQTSAVCGGNITDDGGAPVTERGVCWSTAPGPFITNAHTSNGTGNGSFTSNITGLLNNTKYYVRAFSTNKSGTSYGNEQVFVTASGITNPLDNTNWRGYGVCPAGAHTNTMTLTITVISGTNVTGSVAWDGFGTTGTIFGTCDLGGTSITWTSGNVGGLGVTVWPTTFSILGTTMSGIFGSPSSTGVICQNPLYTLTKQ